MKIQIISIITVFLFLIGCYQDHEEKSNLSGESKEHFYQRKMIEKKFSLTLNDSCGDPLMDTLHKKFTPYIESQEIKNSSAIVQFKFISSGCQKFLGDYYIENGILVFEYEQVNDIACTCLCWYQCKLEINNVKEKFHKILIQSKAIDLSLDDYL